MDKTERAAELIVEVNPPTAVGTIGLCETCRFWNCDNPSPIGACTRSSRSCLAVGGFSAYNDHVLTHKKFGCILHEESE